MTAKSPEEIEGFEYDWLASDADGHIALFSTAGEGFAPEEFLRNPDEHDAAIAAVLAADPSTAPRFAPQLAPEYENTWRLMAERGVFAFDWQRGKDLYELVAAPEMPTGIAALPAVAAGVVRRLALPHLRFASLSEVTKEILRRRE